MFTEKNSDADIIELFHDKKLVKICAPMVRYSKLQFRNLVGKYGCDLAFTPMILADSFCQIDLPVVTQFAANTLHDFLGATHLVAPFCNGVDLNCGCPQSWAKQLGLGCSMLNKPELICDLIKQCQNQINKPFTVSVKLRINKDIRKTVEICRQLEKSGASFLTVHGRTSSQLTGDVNTEALRLIAENINIPLVANGGVKNLEDCTEMQENTKCQGVMVANALLTNPTLFTGSNSTTEECIQNWLDICYNTTLSPSEYLKHKKLKPTIREKPDNLTFQCFHHHLVFMFDKFLTRKQKRIFNTYQKFSEVLDYVEENFNLAPKLYDEDQFNKVKLLTTDYEGRNDVYDRLKPEEILHEPDFIYIYDSNGKFFDGKIMEEEVCDWSDMFLENG